MATRPHFQIGACQKRDFNTLSFSLLVADPQNGWSKMTMVGVASQW
jgi:hypothetical protein